MAEPMNDPVTGLMAGQRADAQTGGAGGTGQDGETTRMDTTDRMADIVSQAAGDTDASGGLGVRTGTSTMDTSKITEHMEVVGSDGDHVGVVDHVNDGQIKLTKNDAEAGGQHHLIPVSMVQSVDDKVRLNVPGRIAQEQWQPA